MIPCSAPAATTRSSGWAATTSSRAVRARTICSAAPATTSSTTRRQRRRLHQRARGRCRRRRDPWRPHGLVDYLSYAGSSAGVTVNLTTRTGSGGDAQGDQYYIYIDGVVGSAFDDVLTADVYREQQPPHGRRRKRHPDPGLGRRHDAGRRRGRHPHRRPGVGHYGSTVLYTDSPSGVTVNLATGTGIRRRCRRRCAAEHRFASLGSDHDDVLIGRQLLSGERDSLSARRRRPARGRCRRRRACPAATAMDTADYSLAAARVAVDLVTGGTAGEAAATRMCRSRTSGVGLQRLPARRRRGERAGGRRRRRHPGWARRRRHRQL